MIKGWVVEKRNTFTKILAITGTILVWLPVAAPVFFSLMRLLGGASFLFDYLMPAEGFPLVLAGSGLLIWTALRARSPLKLICWLLGIGAALLVSGQAVAVVTGLASGAIEPAGWQMVLVTAMIAGYSLTVIGIGIGGIGLLRDLYGNKGSTAGPAGSE